VPSCRRSLPALRGSKRDTCPKRPFTTRTAPAPPAHASWTRREAPADLNEVKALGGDGSANQPRSTAKPNTLCRNVMTCGPTSARTLAAASTAPRPPRRRSTPPLRAAIPSPAKCARAASTRSSAVGLPSALQLEPLPLSGSTRPTDLGLSPSFFRDSFSAAAHAGEPFTRRARLIIVTSGIESADAEQARSTTHPLPNPRDLPVNAGKRWCAPSKPPVCRHIRAESSAARSACHAEGRGFESHQPLRKDLRFTGLSCWGSRFVRLHQRTLVGHSRRRRDVPTGHERARLQRTCAPFEHLAFCGSAEGLGFSETACGRLRSGPSHPH
jgi:hypothetical protein